MKKRTVLAVAAALALATAGVIAGETTGDWFDLENCSICKNLTAQPGLFESLGWEHYSIQSGMMSVTTVPADYVDAYAKAQKGMEAAGQKLMTGEQMPLCNFCQSLGQIMMSGKVQMENVETIGGHIMLITSHDPDLVKQIHAFSKRSTEEMKAMQKVTHHTEG